MANDTERRAIVRRNVRTFREELSFAQEELARAADLSTRSIQRYEVGTSYPDTDALRSLSIALGRPMEDFFAESPPPRDPAKMPAVRFKLLTKMDADLERQVVDFQEKINRAHYERVFAAQESLRRGKKR